MRSIGNGKLGAIVVMVSLAVAIIGGWAMSTDVTTTTEVTYTSLTDITGVFSTDQVPAYIEYDPSTNYTGYYTDSDTKVFDGVEYTQSARANTYKITQADTSKGTGTITATGATGSINYHVYYHDVYGGAAFSLVNNNGYTATLSNVLAMATLPSDADKICLKSTDNYDELDDATSSYSMINLDGVFFSPWSWYTEVNGGMRLNVCSADYLEAYPNSEYHRPCLSAVINVSDSTVTLYYDNDCQEVALTNLALSSVRVAYGGTVSAAGLGLASTVGYAAYAMADPIYMDPSRGVRLED